MRKNQRRNERSRAPSEFAFDAERRFAGRSSDASRDDDWGYRSSDSHDGTGSESPRGTGGSSGGTGGRSGGDGTSSRRTGDETKSIIREDRQITRDELPPTLPVDDSDDEA